MQSLILIKSSCFPIRRSKSIYWNLSSYNCSQVGTLFSLYTAEIKTPYLVFNCSAEDLLNWSVINSEWSVKWIRISSLIHVIGACTQETLSWYSWLRILFQKKNCLISGFPDSSMRRHADKFRQKCQIENFRHTVIKREKIGLNWFKIFDPFQWNQKHGWACWDQALHQRDS